MIATWPRSIERKKARCPSAWRRATRSGEPSCAARRNGSGMGPLKLRSSSARAASEAVSETVTMLSRDLSGDDIRFQRTIFNGRSGRFLQPAPLADDAALDIGLVERAFIGVVFGVVGADLDARGLAMRQHLHALDHEAEPVPDDEDAGRARLAVTGIDENALPRLERRLHAIAHHGDDAQLRGRRRAVAAHDAARYLPFRHDLLGVAEESRASAGADIELFDADGPAIGIGSARRRRHERTLARRVDAGQGIELARLDAARLEDRHQLDHQLQR